jgi:hypothetical protein
MIEELTERIARRAAGSDAKLIEGGAVETTTVATTTPLVLDPPKRKRPNRLLEHVDTAVGPKERRTRKRKVPLAPRA